MQADGTPGWYGKLPSLGDFASRRLPESFIAPWDEWLQASLVASRGRLGDAWLERFLNSPLWRFLLLPGACDQNAWVGVIMPSVDRVGRYFPLTIAVNAGDAAGGLGAMLGGEHWFAAIETIALGILDIQSSVESLDAQLAATPLPRQSDRWQVAEVLAACWRDGGTGPIRASLAERDAIAEVCLMGAAVAAVTDSPGASMWWQIPAGGEPIELRAFRQLPAPADFPPMAVSTPA